MKGISLIFIAGTALYIVSCNSSSADNKTAEQKDTVTVNIVKQRFNMQYKPNVAEIESGKDVTLYFTPKIKGQENEQVALESGHGKKVNLMVVSDDLSQFYQLWPEYQADGSYAVNYKFPNGGKYEYIVVYKPSSNNGEKVIENIPIIVKGSNPAPAAYTATKLTDETEDGYSVTLNVKEGDWNVNSKIRIDGAVEKNGSEVNTSLFDTYQDGKANMVILRLDNKGYDHSHSDAVNGHFDFHHTFKQPGGYRAFLQFKIGGKIYTADFTFKVKG
jgi:plastocyanin